MITEKTKIESNNKTDKQTRYREIIDLLEKYPEGLSARMIAYKLGYRERNATAPRLKELKDKNIVEICGETWDRITERNVAVYKIKEATNDQIDIASK